MLYIGKFINNFKDFYNEINSATLTGAIDVIIVRQPDGSYVCSPFHVRFGKIGVLRSREKVVDIEVNGSPVNIHMKLGESGEAFFVEEVHDENEIPDNFATSPIPEVPDIESELKKMKLSVATSDEYIEEVYHNINADNATKDFHFKLTESELVLKTSSPFNKPDCDKTSDIPSKDTDFKIVSEANKLDQNVPMPGEDSVVLPLENVTNVHTDSSDEVKTKRKRRKKVTMKKRSKTRENNIALSKAVNSLKQVDSAAKDDEVNDKPEEIFQMDDDYTEGDDEGFASAGCLSRSISLPVKANLDDLFSAEWTQRKISSTFIGEFHPFSDGDVTPRSSPVASRPPSPKSDTEYENQKMDTVTPPDAASVPSWGWGQLPNVPRRLSVPQMQSNLMTESNTIIEENNKEEESAVDAEKRSMLGGMLNFMRSTKKIRHMPESEGIYLSELNAEELDPELAALYFPKFKSSSFCPPSQQIKDEDTESGKGPSLPHSPHTVEGYNISLDSDSDGGMSLDQFSKEKCENASYPYSDIAMSLCGGLQDPEIDLPEERFLHSLVTFDEFTENPGILQDPNLVIRIGGKYYNWPTAASMLTSIIMFQRPLPEKTANQLINEHMPKKKKSKSYSSWWSWRRSEAEKTESETTSQEITPVSGTAETMMDENLEQQTCDTETGESVVLTLEETVKETVANVTEVVSEMHDSIMPRPETVQLEEVVVEETLACSYVETNVQVIPPSSESSTSCSSPIDITPAWQTDDASSLSPPENVAQTPPSAKEASIEDETSQFPKEKFKKSLRLTSEQITKLNLQEGPNEFVFSVTTAYQGTTKCHCQVFLWDYDDKIVISDIDGTITKSDVLGHILPMVGHSWAQLGVAKLFSKIQSNGYKFLYLSARAIGQARITRLYLRRIRQGEICLPDGPLLLSPTSLMSALHREVIERKPEEFKISCLKDIQTLFPAYMGNPFYAGFGNKINDTWAYRAVDIPITRVFTINHRGELKLELIQTFQSSYSRLSDDVDHVFPPLKKSSNVNGHPVPIFSSPEEFSYFTYWREPVPALSADDLMV